MTPRSRPLLACAALLAVAPLARAVPREPTAGELALARRLFAEARAAEKGREWATAIAKLREALVVKDTPGLRFHLAFCEEQSGQLVEGLVDYDRAAEALATGSGNAEDAPKLEERRAALRRRVPTLLLRVGDAPAGSALLVDGEPLSATSFGRAVPQNPGIHHVVLAVPGKEPVARDVTLAEGDHAELTLGAAEPPKEPTPVPVAAPQVTTAPLVSPAAPSRSARPWVLGGEAVLVVAGTALGVVALSSASSADDRAAAARASLPASASSNQCVGGGAPDVASTCSALRAANDDKSKAQTMATVSFIGAGVSAAALVGTYLLWPSAKVRASAAPAPGGAVIGLGGAF